MARYTVVSMPGDGIGKTVLPEAIRVLEAVGFDADYVHADIGWDFWINEGNALPERTVELLARHKLGLFGAITSKPKAQAAAELRPDLRGKGYSYFSPIVAMRQRFNLDICLRPCRSFAGNLFTPRSTSSTEADSTGNAKIATTKVATVNAPNIFNKFMAALSSIMVYSICCARPFAIDDSSIHGLRLSLYHKLPAM